MRDLRPPEDVIEDHADDYPEDVVGKALDLASETDSWRYGKRSEGVAAAAVYAAYQLTRLDDTPTQGEVAEQFGVSRVTLQKRYPEIKEIVADLGGGE